MTCKLSLSSPFIIIRIKLFAARSVVRSVVFLCRSLSFYTKEETTTHSFFCSFLSERDHEFSSAKTANTRGRGGGVEATNNNQRCRFHFFLLQKPRLPKTVAPREETHKNLSSFFQKKKKSIFSHQIRASFCTKITHVKHNNGSYETNRS